MSLKRRASATFTALALCLGLSACGGSATDTPTSGDQSGAKAAPTQGLDTDGVVTVGVPTFPPFVGFDNGQITGPEGKIINEIAKINGWEVEAVSYDFAALIPAVQKGRVDIGIGSLFRTHARAESVDFTDPIYIEPGSIVSKQGYSSVRELVDLKVGTVQGFNWVDDVDRVLGGDLKQYPSSSELKADLESGRLDAAIDSNGTALYLYADTEYKVNVIEPDEEISASTNPGQTAIILEKGNAALAEQLNAAIAELHANGFIAQTLQDAGLDPNAAKIGEPSYL
ncbi:ABC transporter substrate-binding protein [Schaalia vaccimaxillae]|uniref:ABC transporter substrate-binding protein n=1 Tax=Schaalia vaccimaxillae TaxID=183916 RepID=UPI0003B660D9|nr:ABC transporter substrate-binding protein [Schaalia vaccimaxillae]